MFLFCLETCPNKLITLAGSAALFQGWHFGGEGHNANCESFKRGGAGLGAKIGTRERRSLPLLCVATYLMPLLSSPELNTICNGE